MSIAFYISIKHSLDFKTHECPLFTNNIYFTTFWWIVSVRYTHNYNLSDGNANDKTRMRLIVIRFSLNCHPFCCLSNCQPNQTIIIFFVSCRLLLLFQRPLSFFLSIFVCALCSWALVMRCIYQFAVMFICFLSIVEMIQLVVN